MKFQIECHGGALSSAVNIIRVDEFVFQYTAKPVLADTKGTEEKCPL